MQMSAKSSQCTDTSELRLRPHHLLCLQTFIGRGYSKEFVEHMTLVKKQLTDEPHTPITLVHGADDLCTHCPNCVEGRCISEKPAIFDRLVKEKLMACKQYSGFSSSSDSGSLRLHGIPKELQISDDILVMCCPGCEWKELCKRVSRRF